MISGVSMITSVLPYIHGALKQIAADGGAF